MKKNTRGFTLVELIITIFVIMIPLTFVLPIWFYHGERVVETQMVDCIGIFGSEPELPEGYHWEIGAQPLVPGVLIFPFVVPGAITLLTDAKCPEPDVTF